MNLSGLNDHFVNGHHLSDGIASGLTGMTPDQVTNFKMPKLNTAAITSNVTGYTSFTLRDIPSTQTVPYVDVKYATAPGGGGMVLATFTACPMKVANTTGASFGAMKIFDLPFGWYNWGGGNVYFSTVDWSATTNSTGSGIGSGGSGDFSVGSTGTADATLGGTDVDIVASTAFLDPFVNGVGHSNVGIGWANSATQIDGSTEATSGTAKAVYLNVIIDDADVADADETIIKLTGVWRFRYIFQGDYDI